MGLNLISAVYIKQDQKKESWSLLESLAESSTFTGREKERGREGRREEGKEGALRHMYKASMHGKKKIKSLIKKSESIISKWEKGQEGGNHTNDGMPVSYSSYSDAQNITHGQTWAHWLALAAWNPTEIPYGTSQLPNPPFPYLHQATHNLSHIKHLLSPNSTPL